MGSLFIIWDIPSRIMTVVQLLRLPEVFVLNLSLSLYTCIYRCSLIIVQQCFRVERYDKLRQTDIASLQTLLAVSTHFTHLAVQSSRAVPLMRAQQNTVLYNEPWNSTPNTIRAAGAGFASSTNRLHWQTMMSRITDHQAGSQFPNSVDEFIRKS